MGCFSLKRHIDLNGKNILVTGSPGFIGSFLVMRLLKEMANGTVVSLDNMSPYYNIRLKEYRLDKIEEIASRSNVQHCFIRGDLADKVLIDDVFTHYIPDIVVNLAAQAGVRYSVEHPDAYINSNIIGFYNLLETIRKYTVEHFVYASSSSVYGENKKIPFSTEDKVSEPSSLYAATKASDELMAYAYSKLYGIPMTGLRFFTVYGPAGRPDMFYYSAADALVNGGTIQIYNHGDMQRDFTYIDDIIDGIVLVMREAPALYDENGNQVVQHCLYNIGGGTPVNLLVFVETLQKALVSAGVLPENYDFEAHRELVGMQPGDIPLTYADSSALKKDFGFVPSIPLEKGLREFAVWYKKYHNI